MKADLPRKSYKSFIFIDSGHPPHAPYLDLLKSTVYED